MTINFNRPAVLALELELELCWRSNGIARLVTEATNGVHQIDTQIVFSVLRDYNQMFDQSTHSRRIMFAEWKRCRHIIRSHRLVCIIDINILMSMVCMGRSGAV